MISTKSLSYRPSDRSSLVLRCLSRLWVQARLLIFDEARTYVTYFASWCDVTPVRPI